MEWILEDKLCKELKVKELPIVLTKEAKEIKDECMRTAFIAHEACRVTEDFAYLLAKGIPCIIRAVQIDGLWIVDALEKVRR